MLISRDSTPASAPAGTGQVAEGHPLQATAQRRVTVPGRGGEGIALPIVMQSADLSADAFSCSGESLHGPTPPFPTSYFESVKLPEPKCHIASQQTARLKAQSRRTQSVGGLLALQPPRPNHSEAVCVCREAPATAIAHIKRHEPGKQPAYVNFGSLLARPFDLNRHGTHNNNEITPQ